MRIAFCTPGSIEFEDYKNYNLLGTEFQVFGLAKELAKKGLEICIIRRWYKGSVHEELIENIRVINVASPEFPDLHIQKIATKMLFSYHMKREISAINPDLLILTDLFSSYLLCKIDIPKIYITHNPPADLALDTNRVKLTIKKFVERTVFRKCQIVISLNRYINKYLNENGYHSLYIPNAIDIDRYIPNYSDSKYILFGGRFVKIKKLDILIRAYYRINNKLMTKYRLILVGYGPEKEMLEKLIKELELGSRIELIPWLPSDRFIKMISGCTVFLLPSLSECMPVTVLEAMASGKVVIASNIPGPQDIISSNYDGFLFDNSDIDSLSNYLDMCLSDEGLRRNIGKNARKTIVEKYSFEVISNRYISLFESIIGKN